MPLGGGYNKGRIGIPGGLGKARKEEEGGGRVVGVGCWSKVSAKRVFCAFAMLPCCYEFSFFRYQDSDTRSRPLENKVPCHSEVSLVAHRLYY